MGEVGSLTKSSYLIVMVEETEFFSFFDAKLRIYSPGPTHEKSY